jgi:thioredoxin-like negative regulator of GroEL
LESIFQPFLITVASIAALAEGVTEIMYFAFAPRSSAVVGTIVELSEKTVSKTIRETLRRFPILVRMISPRALACQMWLQI